MSEKTSQLPFDPARLPRVINSLKFAYFAYFFSVGCIHNFYPILLKKIQIPNSRIGIMSSIGLVGGTISPITIGFLADKTKRSRLILIMVTLLSIIFHTVPITVICLKIIIERSKHVDTGTTVGPTLAFIYTLYIFQFAVTFMDQGTKALMDSVSHKIVAESTKAGVPSDFARLRMFGSMGLMITTVFAGFMMDHFRKMMPWGLPEEIILVFVCGVMGCCLVLLLVANLPHVETKGQVSFVDAVKQVVTRVDGLICFFAQFLIQFATNVTRNFETLYIQHLGGNKAWTGTCTSLGYASDVLMMYLSPTITSALGSREYTIAFGAIIAVVRTLFYGYADNKYMAINNAILYGFSSGMIIPTMSSLIKSKAPEALISSYVSLLQATGKIGGSIASLLGGILSEKYSYKLIFVIASAFFGMGGLLILFYNFCFTKKPTTGKSGYEMVTPEKEEDLSKA